MPRQLPPPESNSSSTATPSAPAPSAAQRPAFGRRDFLQAASLGAAAGLLACKSEATRSTEASPTTSIPRPRERRALNLLPEFRHLRSGIIDYLLSSKRSRPSASAAVAP